MLADNVSGDVETSVYALSMIAFCLKYSLISEVLPDGWMCLYDYAMHACSCFIMKLSGLVCMYSGGACFSSNHYMVAYLRGNDTMQCAQSQVYMEIYFSILLDVWLDVGTLLLLHVYWGRLLDICMLASLLSKTNIHFRCWTRCSNIQTWFCVFCTLPCFMHAFIYLRNPRVNSYWSNRVSLIENQNVCDFLKECYLLRKVWR